MVRYVPFGDSALLVEFGDAVSLKLNRKTLSLYDRIREAGVSGIDELVPTYRSLLIRYDPLKVSFKELALRVKRLESEKGESRARRGKKIVVPVVYGGEYGPDLEFIARSHGLMEDEVVKLHSNREYVVYMIGFVAGFPYLGEVADEIATPRLETPRLKVPKGSVGIAEKQTGIYPCEAPGGWQIIGRTPLKLFDPSDESPALLEPGDTVKFKPISEEEFRRLPDAVAKK